MLVAITGTPGTGKSSVSDVLKENEYNTVDLIKLAIENDFLIGVDEERDTKIIDTNRLNKFVKENYEKDDTVFFEGHLSHLLKSMDKVIVLRSHPKILKQRLAKKGWSKKKINENVEAEVLDIILCEAVEVHSNKDIFEIDTTDKSIDSVAMSIIEISNNNFKHMKKYNIGTIDWSKEILKDF